MIVFLNENARLKEQMLSPRPLEFELFATTVFDKRWEYRIHVFISSWRDPVQLKLAIHFVYTAIARTPSLIVDLPLTRNTVGVHN